MLKFIRKSGNGRKSASKSPLKGKPPIEAMAEIPKNIDEIDKTDAILQLNNESMEEMKGDSIAMKEIVPDDENAIKENEQNSPAAIQEMAEEKSEEPVEDAGNSEDDFKSIAATFAKENGIADADLKAGMKILKEIRDGWRDGNLTTDMLALVLRGVEYDKAVKEAREAGELEGRNKQIEEKYMYPVESDGLPHLGGSCIRKKTSRISSIFDLARNA